MKKESWLEDCEGKVLTTFAYDGSFMILSFDDDTFSVIEAINVDNGDAIIAPSHLRNVFKQGLDHISTLSDVMSCEEFWEVDAEYEREREEQERLNRFNQYLLLKKEFGG